ncbi:Acyl-CoA thioesterase 2 [Streptomyces tanashiensis]
MKSIIASGWACKCPTHTRHWMTCSICSTWSGSSRTSSGASPAPRSSRVFGGQVAARARCGGAPCGGPAAPACTVLRAPTTRSRGSSTVDRLGDGRSHDPRAVAVQHGQPIFHLSASFQAYEEGLDHQVDMPPAPDPESLDTPAEMLPRHLPREVADRLVEARAAVGLRYADVPPWGSVGQPREPRSQVWFRTNGKLADDPLLHVVLATYVSDMTLLDSVLLAHGRGGWAVGDVVGASLDRAMRLRRPFRADEWLLYDQESPTSSGGRGLGEARI